MRKLNVTQAGVVSLFVYAVGQVVAYVPSLAPQQAGAISAGSLVIAAVFAVVHAVHAVVEVVRDLIANRKAVTLAELEQGIRAFAQDEIGKVDIGQLAAQAVSGQNVPALVKTEVGQRFEQFLRGLATQSAPVPVTAPAPPVAPPLV